MQPGDVLIGVDFGDGIYKGLAGRRFIMKGYCITPSMKEDRCIYALPDGWAPVGKEGEGFEPDGSITFYASRFKVDKFLTAARKVKQNGIQEG